MENKEQKDKKVEKKLDIQKLKFLKEYSIRYDVQAGGCGYNAGCSHWA